MCILSNALTLSPLSQLDRKSTSVLVAQHIDPDNGVRDGLCNFAFWTQLYRSADKNLARPGREQATATKRARRLICFLQPL
jgi:hypothetical protein